MNLYSDSLIFKDSLPQIFYNLKKKENRDRSAEQYHLVQPGKGSRSTPKSGLFAMNMNLFYQRVQKVDFTVKDKMRAGEKGWAVLERYESEKCHRRGEVMAKSSVERNSKNSSGLPRYSFVGYNICYFLG